MSRQSPACASLLVFTLTLAINSPVQAIVRTWNSNSGIFTNIGNWAPNDAYPGPSDTAEFNSGPVAYIVTFPGSFINPPVSYVVDKLVVRTNDVTFATQSFISPNLTAAGPEDSIVIGAPFPGATLNMTLRSLTGATIDVGDSGGFGRLNVRNGAGINSNVLNVGRDGAGTLLIEAGGRVASDNATIGLPIGQSDTVTVRGVGSTLTVNGLLNAVNWAWMTIRDGGALVTGEAHLGSPNPASSSIGRITGTGSTWTNSGDIRIGGVDALGTKYGELLVADGAVVSVGGALFVQAGQSPGDFSSAFIGKNATVEGDVINEGYVQTGLREVSAGPYVPGTFQLDGNYVQSATGTLGIGIAGTTPRTEHDQLKVDGSVTLNGRLFVSLNNSFQPSAGDTFDILDWTSLTGTFSTLQLPAISAGLAWDTSQLYTTGLLRVALPGDYNSDGSVDAADYVVWRKNLGGGTSLPNDDTPGVGPDDYTRWRANFGRMAGSNSGAITNAAVPEPTAIVLFVGALVALSIANARQCHTPCVDVQIRAIWSCQMHASC